MSKQVQKRRGTSAEHSNFVGAVAEITVDTETNELVLGDGVTAGGRRVGISRVTTSDLVNSVVKYPESDVIETCGFTTAGDGGGAKWVQNGVTGQTPSQTPAQLADGLLNDASGNQWAYVLNKKITPESLGAVGDGVTDDTLPIQASIDFANRIGGGRIIFTGHYLVVKLNPVQGGANPQDYAIHFYGDNITLEFIGGSKIIHDLSLPRYIPIRWGPLPIINGQTVYSNSHIKNIEIDGNYTINPSDSPDENMLLWISGLRDSSCSGYFHNSKHYGVGMQNGGRINFKLYDVLVEDVLHDGIDIKNNGSNDYGCVLDNITVRRFGRATDISTPFAGVDVMGEVKLSNIKVEDFGDIGTAAAGVRFKQGEANEDRGIGGHNSKMVNFDIKALSGSYAADGVNVVARSVKLVNGDVKGATSAGVRARQELCKAVNVECVGCEIGFQSSDSTYLTNGDKMQLVNCTTQNSINIGYRAETTACSYTSCNSYNDNTGFDLRSGAIDTKWLGGEISGSTVNKVTNTGTNTLVVDCTGVNTFFNGETPSVDIDVIDSKSANITHNLSFTPPSKDISLSMIRSVNNVPSVINYRIAGASSTLVSVQAVVTSPSPTTGDTTSFSVVIDSRYIPTGNIN